MSILVDENTTILIQGITGREGTTMTRAALDYGSKVVSGVTPGRGGREVHGVPVYDCIKSAIRDHPCNTAVVGVPPAFVRGATLEALDNDIPLVVVLTERAPRKDVADIVSFADKKGARVVGPNSLGLISPHKTKVGMVGGPAEDVMKAYSPGSVGILSRSGGMTTELANLLTINGIGQSTAVSIGGDPIVGSTYADLVPLFEQDPDTKAVVIFCEPGGTSEEALADYVIANKVKLPIIAFVAGRFADDMPGMRFGHAAVVVEGDRGSTASKIRRFKEAGILVAEEFNDIIKYLGDVL
jgi:succinyl-CoA synthetase alpha subunit